MTPWWNRPRAERGRKRPEPKRIMEVRRSHADQFLHGAKDGDVIGVKDENGKEILYRVEIVDDPRIH